ncbi:MAG: vanadium-dependent haloperoxidase, partial [Flavobacteriales bacterium]|nr:vanadium-dependent haloperoxidase [Flavobacteriales bacterium]
MKNRNSPFTNQKRTHAMPTYHPSLSVRLDDLTLRAIVKSKTPPPMAARILAIVHTCVYDAWACYQPKSLGTRMLGLLRRNDIQDYEKEVQEAIAHAAYRALDEYFGSLNLANPNGNPLLKTFMTDNGYDPAITDDSDLNIPAHLGNRCARAVLDYRRGDGANTFKTINPSAWYADYTDYKPALEPEDEPVGELTQHWQPLRKADGTQQQFLVPHWGRVQPFGLPDGSVFRPPVPPAAWDSLVLRQEAEELIYLNANLTNEQKAICEYWLDGSGSITPPGHWMRIGEEIARRDRHDLDRDVKMFFALGNAVMDAGIAAWDCKRHYDYVRPITLIRNWYKDKDIMGWGGPGVGTVKMKGKD